MGDEDDGLADLGLQAQELVLQALAVDRVDRAERLVHEHQRRVGGERAGHADALALAARELGGIAVAQRAFEPDEVEQGVDALGDPRARPAEQARHRRDVLADRLVREQPDLLDDVADLAPQLGGIAVADRPAAEQDVAVGDVDHPVDHPHRSGLAAPRRADEHADVARGHGQRQVVDRIAVGAGVTLDGGAELELRRLGLGGVGWWHRGREL